MRLGWRGRLGLVWIVIGVLVGALSVSLEERLADPLVRVEAGSPAPDPSGRTLYLLIIDSLALANVAEMPHLQALADGNFFAPVQPCTDNFTFPCVREALTGRTSFSLLVALKNLGVGKQSVRNDLLADADAAEWRTALVSRGDLAAWERRADTDLRVRAKADFDHLTAALKVAGGHHLVIHHYVDHDVVTHHRRRGSPEYQASLAKADALVAGLVADLPPTMDLLVTGDHGHTAAGRHLQGLDVPTAVILRSPRVAPRQLEERIPLTAIRFLAGAVTGLGSKSMGVDPAWTEWMAPGVSPPIGPDPGSMANPHPDRPWVLLLVSVALCLAGLAALDWRVGLAVGLWGIGWGLGFPHWLVLTHSRGGVGSIQNYSPLFPVLGAAIGFAWTRARSGLWTGLVVGVAVVFLGLLPGQGRHGILQNLLALWLPLALGAAGLVAAQWLQRGRVSREVGIAAVMVCVGGLLMMQQSLYHSSDFTIWHRPVPKWWHATPAMQALLAGTAGAVLGGLAWSRWGVVLLCAVAAAMGTVLPGEWALGPMVLFFVALAVLRGGRRRAAAMCCLLLLSGMILPDRRQLGALATVMALGLQLAGLAGLHRQIPALGHTWTARLAGALLLGVGAYLGLGYTIGVQVAGLDFQFAMAWFPGRWHERLWFLVAFATAIKTYLPLLMLLVVVGARFGGAWPAIVGWAAGLCMLRGIGSLVLSGVWVADAGLAASGSRLVSILHGGMLWWVSAIVLVACTFLPGPRVGPATVEPQP